MKILVIVVGIALLAAAEAAPCDSQKFQQCLGSFAKDLGMAKIPADINEFALALGQLIQKDGLEGQKKICTAMKNMKTCLGDQYDSCISKAYLESIGESVGNASGFVAMAAEYGYMCTTGWDVISKNWDCMVDVGKKNKEYLAKCLSDYQEKIQKDPANVCKYSQEYANCFFAPYTKGCGSALGSTLCEAMKISSAQILPTCSITCSTDPKPANIGK